ncbi:MAG: hypothetical protein ACK4UR_02405 [Caldimicrobium sp.]
MKKVVSLMLALGLAGMIGLTAGCKKKEEAPAPEAPKTEQPAQPAQTETANQTTNQTEQAPAEKEQAPAEKK